MALILSKPRLIKCKGVWVVIWQESDLPMACQYWSDSRDQALDVAFRVGKAWLEQRKAFSVA